MTTPDLLTNLRAYLISEGIVRLPRNAGDLPPCWLEPRDGAPAPGERAGDEGHDTAGDPASTVSVFRSGGITPEPTDQRYFQMPTIDVVLRTRTPNEAPAIQEAITLAMVNPTGNPASSPGMNWTMAALNVIDSQLWRDWQPLDFSEQAYTVVGSFLFQLYTDLP